MKPDREEMPLSAVNALQELAERQIEGGGKSGQMAKPDLAHSPFKIRNVNLMYPGMLSQVDLSPASFFAELPNSLAKLEADIRGHPPSIDLVEALYLADALSALTQCKRAG